MTLPTPRLSPSKLYAIRQRIKVRHDLIADPYLHPHLHEEVWTAKLREQNQLVAQDAAVLLAELDQVLAVFARRRQETAGRLVLLGGITVYLWVAGLAVALGLLSVVDTDAWYSFLAPFVASVSTSVFWIVALFGKKRSSR